MSVTKENHMSDISHLKTRQMTIEQDGQKIIAVIASETPVDRGDYTEILRISPLSVDLSRFPVPLIKSHDMSELPIGVVENPRFEEKKLVADLVISDTKEGQEISKSIQDGILRNVSIGYSIKESEQLNSNQVLVTRYEIYEVSLVSVNADPEAQIKQSRNFYMSTDTQQISQIISLAKHHNQIELAQDAIERGQSLEQFRKRLLDKIQDKPLQSPSDDYLGLSPKDERKFSITRAIEAKATNDWSNAGFEAEVLRETSKRSKHGGIVLPPHMMRRDLVTGSPANGSNMIQTNILGDSFIDALFAQSAILDQCTTLTGNVGDIAIPKMTSGSSAAWYTETGQLTESSPVIGQLSLAPKTVAAFTEVSRRMIQQGSTDVESLLRRDMANQISSAIDSVIIQGGGTNEPTGVLETTGIGSVAMGTNGGSITYAALVDLVKEVALDNALNGNLAFVTNSKVIAAMRQTSRQASGIEGNFILNEENTLLGFPVLSTNNTPSDLDKGTSTGVCSAVLFGNWADVIVGFWSNLEVLVDPYTKADYNLVRIRTVTDIDVGIRHPESFSAIQDVTT